MAALPAGIASRVVNVNGESMHYLECGEGAPVLFLHGNPTSSCLWRNVLPHVAGHGCCIAIDLIGMGRSGKPRIPYRLQDHVAYLDEFIDALDLSDIVFVMHDWGVSLGLHYLSRFPERVRGVAFMEGHLHPIERWADFDSGGEELFRRLRSEEKGRRMAIDENIFVETILPMGTVRTLSQTELDAYREPFLNPEDREPLWRWPQEIPIEGQPADVEAIVLGYREALAASDIPKLLFHATPGAVIGPEEVDWCRSTLTNLTTVDLGEGIHFLPEDHPDAIGRAVASWLTGHAVHRPTEGHHRGQ